MKRPLKAMMVAAMFLALDGCSGMDFRGEPVTEAPVAMPSEEGDQTSPTPEDQQRAAVETSSPPEDEGRATAASQEPADRPVTAASTVPALMMGIINQGHLYLGLDEAARREKFSAIEARYLRNPTPRNLVRYALVTTLSENTNQTASERVRTDLAAYLLQNNPEGGTTEKESLKPLAALLSHLLNERERLRSELMTQVDDLKRKIRETQHKLDELKAIEDQLRKRDNSETIGITP